LKVAFWRHNNTTKHILIELRQSLPVVGDQIRVNVARIANRDVTYSRVIGSAKASTCPS
jgi:hypothetical protein